MLNFNSLENKRLKTEFKSESLEINCDFSDNNSQMTKSTVSNTSRTVHTPIPSQRNDQTNYLNTLLTTMQQQKHQNGTGSLRIKSNPINIVSFSSFIILDIKYETAHVFLYNFDDILVYDSRIFCAYFIHYD